MNSGCSQALSPGLSDAKTPDSLYPREHALTEISQNADNNLVVIKTNSSPTLTTDDCMKQEQIHLSFEDFNFGKFGFREELDFGHQLRDNAVSDCSDVGSPDSTLLSPGSLSPTTPVETFIDSSTQMTLCEKSESMHLEEAINSLDPEVYNEIISEVSQSLPSPPLSVETPRKVRKSSEMDDAPNSAASLTRSSPLPFDAGAAVSSSQFIFTKFGKDVASLNSLNAAASLNINTSNILSTRTAVTTIESAVDLDAEEITLVVPPPKKLKEPSLNLTFPAKSNGAELKILVQPEENHRARYMTEGSRGAVKDRTQEGFPVVKLYGYEKEKAVLQVFIGNDTGKVKPHGFYQACKVCGKTASHCKEIDIEGTTVIQIPLDPKDNMEARIDCVGILKLRNADVEKRIGLARSKKKSTKVRLVFRVNLPKANGSYHTLQVASLPISCTQPAGQPEICKKSMKEAFVDTEEELFIIGKNFMKGTKVIFQEVKDSQVVWKEEGEMDMEFFQPNHLICKVPQYKDTTIVRSVQAQVMVQSSGRTSDPHPFTYKPVAQLVEDDEPMEPVETTKKSCVSKEALQLNRLYSDALANQTTKDAILATTTTSENKHGQTIKQESESQQAKTTLPTVQIANTQQSKALQLLLQQVQMNPISQTINVSGTQQIKVESPTAPLPVIQICPLTTANGVQTVTNQGAASPGVVPSVQPQQSVVSQSTLLALLRGANQTPANILDVGMVKQSLQTSNNVIAPIMSSVTASGATQISLVENAKPTVAPSQTDFSLIRPETVLFETTKAPLPLFSADDVEMMLNGGLVNPTSS